MPTTQLAIYDPQHHRDTSWITDDCIYEYCAAELRGPMAAMLCVEKWALQDRGKIQQFQQIIVGQPDLEIIKGELIDEYGEEYFVGKPRSVTFHIRQLELRMQMCVDSADYAKLANQLATLQGWNVKPLERPSQPATNVTVTLEAPTVAGKDVREAQRIVMSVLANNG